MKNALGKVFHDRLTIRAVPAGWAVSTAFTLSNGEPPGFYIVGPDSAGRVRLEDDGTAPPMIEAAGVDLDTSVQSGAVAKLCAEYGAVCNLKTGELSTPPMTADLVPHRALQFVALLLRLQDLLLPASERIEQPQGRAEP